MNALTRRQFSQLWTGIFAVLCGIKIEPDHIEAKDNTGYSTHRISEDVPLDWKLIEKGLSEEWSHWNDPKRNGGHGILQDLMIQNSRIAGIGDDYNPWVSDRERKIVGEVIQWLGTNVGRGFLFAASQRMGCGQYPFQAAISKWQEGERIESLKTQLAKAHAEIRRLKA